MGANETWGDAPAAPAAAPGFEAAGFETAGELLLQTFVQRVRVGESVGAHACVYVGIGRRGGHA